MPSINVSLPDGTEATHELTDDGITVGRIEDNGIQIEDPSVSSHHAEFHQRGDEYAVVDIGSTNGSQINGRPLPANEEHVLKHGDELIFGHISVRYLSKPGTISQPLPLETEPELAIGVVSVAPVDFANASPFPKRSSQRDTAGMAVLAVGIVALLGAIGAIFLAMNMAPPSGL